MCKGLVVNENGMDIEPLEDLEGYCNETRFNVGYLVKVEEDMLLLSNRVKPVFNEDKKVSSISVGVSPFMLEIDDIEMKVDEIFSEIGKMWNPQIRAFFLSLNSPDEKLAFLQTRGIIIS